MQDKDPVSESDMVDKISHLLLQDEKKWLGTRSLHLTVKSAIDHPDKENMRYWDITLDNVIIIYNQIFLMTNSVDLVVLPHPVFEQNYFCFLLTKLSQNSQ